ncbi:MAG TPA: response regulator [Clostridiales bacterium]|nr:response regulator [Clostridiales bacterium]
MYKKKILIIDDTELIVKIIKDILETADYNVISASSGEEGLIKVEQEKPDLVILDVVLPGMDGFQVCRMLRNDDRNNLMPIIILTSQCDEDDKLTGLELGADDYIIKPFNPRELLSRVRNTLVRIDRNRYVNPLTGLHGNIEIQTEMNQKIASNEIFSLIYADIDNFKAYNDVYGFANGDIAIKLTADILNYNMRLFGTPGNFLGHIGGDDFIIITMPQCVDDICKGIIHDFDIKILNLYNEEDRKNGYIITTNRRGEPREFPIMTISMAVVSNEYRDFKTYYHIAEVAAEIKKVVKSMNGSCYSKDRRRC